MAIAERERKGTMATFFGLDQPETLRRLTTLMAPVQFKVAITGTSSGVGVSTFTLNLALALKQTRLEESELAPHRTPNIGILDLGGSPFSQRLGTNSHAFVKRRSRFLPAHGIGDLKIISMDMFSGDRFRRGMAGLQDWGTVQRSLGQVNWVGLDLLLIEFPAGIEVIEDLSEVLPPIDGAVIVTRPGEREKNRIKAIWKFLDLSSTPAIGLVSNMERVSKGSEVEGLGQTFGIPIRAKIPYASELTNVQAGVAPYILAQKESEASRNFFHLADDLVEYLFWLHDEHEQEDDS